MSSNTQIIQGLTSIGTDDKRHERQDRRVRHDRLNMHALRGRRHSARRSKDVAIAHHAHTDQHEPHIFWATVMIMLLCVFDAHYTLMLISRGGVELNHFMDALIQHSMFSFILVKFSATALSLFILVAHHKFHMFERLRVHYLIYSFLLVYIVLISYELYIWPASLSEIYPVFL